jgi:hypothetical protein
MPSFRLLVPALFALALCGTPPRRIGAELRQPVAADIETIVRDYLLGIPKRWKRRWLS